MANTSRENTRQFRLSIRRVPLTSSSKCTETMTIFLRAESSHSGSRRVSTSVTVSCAKDRSVWSGIWAKARFRLKRTYSSQRTKFSFAREAQASLQCSQLPNQSCSQRIMLNVFWFSPIRPRMIFFASNRSMSSWLREAILKCSILWPDMTNPSMENGKVLQAELMSKCLRSAAYQIPLMTYSSIPVVQRALAMQLLLQCQILATLKESNSLEDRRNKIDKCNKEIDF